MMREQQHGGDSSKPHRGVAEVKALENPIGGVAQTQGAMEAIAVDQYLAAEGSA